MLVFPTSRTSVMLLMAALTAIMGWLICREGRHHFGLGYGIAGGLFFICLPTVQESSSMVMAEIPMAVFTSWRCSGLARFLDENNWQDACWFGVWSSIAILTKGNAWALALAPPLALLLTRDLKRAAELRFMDSGGYRY